MFFPLAVGGKRPVWPRHLQFCDFCHFCVFHLNKILLKELIVIQCSSAVAPRDQQGVETNLAKREEKSRCNIWDVLWKQQKMYLFNFMFFFCFVFFENQLWKADNCESVKHLHREGPKPNARTQHRGAKLVRQNFSHILLHIFFFSMPDLTWTSPEPADEAELPTQFQFFLLLEAFDSSSSCCPPYRHCGLKSCVCGVPCF